MAKFAINPTGLKPKPTYESQIQYIANQPTIAYPDRSATFAARSMKANQLFNEHASQLAEQQARADLLKTQRAAMTGVGTAPLTMPQRLQEPTTPRPPPTRMGLGMTPSPATSSSGTTMKALHIILRYGGSFVAHPRFHATMTPEFKLQFKTTK